MPKPTHKKAPFIDKKSAVSFHLVHRSQQDPLAADEDAPQHVLKLVDKSEKAKVKGEEREYGVFFDDDYNYLQHLKDREEVEHDWSEADRFILQAQEQRQVPEPTRREPGADLHLPSEVFATEGMEEQVGLLNKAARTTGLDLSLDPDIVAAMADDFDFDDPENALDDDFLMQAMDEDGEGGEEYNGSDVESCSDVDSEFGGGRSGDEEDDEVPSLLSWNGEETGTKFTNYSMSSSCIRRNNQLTLLDDKFDKFMDDYGEMDQGDLEGEEIEGTVEEESDRMQQLLLETEQERKLRRQQLDRAKEIAKGSLLIDEDEESQEEMEKVEITVGEKWDCESVLSTYSTLYNHPTLISEPRKSRPAPIELSNKTGMPLGVLGRGLTAAALRQLDAENGETEEGRVEEDLRSRVSMLSVRPAHETKEEKKGRKAAVKELRRERRSEKKMNTKAFKDEADRQKKININLKNNLQGIKIC